MGSRPREWAECLLPTSTTLCQSIQPPAHPKDKKTASRTPGLGHSLGLFTTSLSISNHPDFLNLNLPFSFYFSFWLSFSFVCVISLESEYWIWHSISTLSPFKDRLFLVLQINISGKRSLLFRLFLCSFFLLFVVGAGLCYLKHNYTKYLILNPPSHRQHVYVSLLTHLHATLANNHF